MALRRRDLEHEQRPDLAVVPAPPRRPRVAPAIALVVLLIGVLVAPVIRAALVPVPPAERPRPVLASAIGALDPMNPMPPWQRPKSPRPVGGIAFVSCTHLWEAMPDGSSPHRVLDMPGIASPTFSPSGRTIAFLAPDGNEQAIYMTAATGGRVVEVGPIAHEGTGPPAAVTNLTWSPDGRELLLSLVTPAQNLWRGGSVLYALHLATGRITRVARAYPAPFFVDGHLAYNAIVRGGPSVVAMWHHRARIQPRLSRPGRTLSVATVPSGWSAAGPGAAVLKAGPNGAKRLEIKRYGYDKHGLLTVKAPPDHQFAPLTRPQISQDGARVSIGLVDSGGQQDLGMLDTATGRWTVTNYAWQPAASTIPTSTGPPGARRAIRTAGDLLRLWDDGPREAALLLGHRPRKGLLPFTHIQYVAHPAVREGTRWIVDASVFGDVKGTPLAYRDVAVTVYAAKGRLRAAITPSSPVIPIATVDEAVAFIRHMIGSSVVPPVDLPAGMSLAGYPLYANSFGGHSTAQLNLKARGGRGMTISYGNAYFQSCGEVDGHAGAVGSAPALRAHLGDQFQVLWPATKKSYPGRGARYGVFGYGVSKATVMRVARGMEAERS
jgi:hypothetical protein